MLNPDARRTRQRLANAARTTHLNAHLAFAAWPMALPNERRRARLARGRRARRGRRRRRWKALLP
eukprot:7059122-Lingulodinium_polyedra.AAC.1